MKNEIRNLVIEEYDTIQEEETIKDAISKFAKEKNRPKTLLVFNDDGQYQGVITEREIFRKGAQSDERKIKHTYQKAPKLEENTSIFETARLLLESNCRHLPVFDGKTIKGIVAAVDVMKASLDGTNMGDTLIRRFMSSTPTIVSPQDKIASVMNLFNQHAISRVPVVENNKPVGIITKHDIVTKVFTEDSTISFNAYDPEKQGALAASAQTIMSYPLKTLKSTDKTAMAMDLMDEFDISSVLITDYEDNLSGILTCKDLLEALASLARNTQEQKIFMQLRGDVKELEPHEKSEIMVGFENLIKKHENLFHEAHAFIYLKKHQGRNTKGKTRNVEMYFVRARISTDAGTYIASTEEFGLGPAVHEAVRMIEKQINTAREKARDRAKISEDETGFAIKASI